MEREGERRGRKTNGEREIESDRRAKRERNGET